MASLPDAELPKPSLLLPLAAVVVTGFAAAGVILLSINDRTIAAGFLGAAVMAAGLMLASARLFRAPMTVERYTDWAIAHALASASDDALAVTDRSGRLVCANPRYEALFGGWPTPLVEGPRGGRLCEDGSARSPRGRRYPACTGGAS